MQSTWKILAAADRSPHATHVIKYAIDIAKRIGAEIDFLYVDVLHGEPYDKQVEIHRKRFIEEQLAARDATGLTVQLVSEKDTTPAPAILRYADENECTMIVMGTHGRRGVRALVLGSVAQEVIRFAPCPVFTVSGRDAEQLDIGMIDRILVPIDFSRHAIGALKYARGFSDLIAGSMEIIHIVEDTFHPAFYGPFHHSIYDVNPEIEALSRRNIIRLLERTGGYDARTTIDVFKGHPSRDIATWATDHGSELIVMATHGLTGMQHLFIGSVAERTVQLAPCPVVTIHVDILPEVEPELEDELEVAVV